MLDKHWADKIETKQKSLGTSKTKSALGEFAAGFAASGMLGFDNMMFNSIKQSLSVSANPFSTLIYQATSLKTHAFSWTFFPESVSETNTIRKIVGYFRREMLPEILSSNKYLLVYPAIFEIMIYPESLQSYMQYKKCVLVGVDVDYTPAGPSFIRTENSVANKGRDADICPAAVTLQLQFAEVELWTANDFSANESESFDYINNKPLNVEKPTTVQDAVAASGGGGFSFAGDK